MVALLWVCAGVPGAGSLQGVIWSLEVKLPGGARVVRLHDGNHGRGTRGASGDRWWSSWGLGIVQGGDQIQSGVRT
jgi:hypothetical protein